MDHHLVVSLFRHGITSGNEKRQYVGHTDVPLTKQGIHQAEETHEAIKEDKVDELFTSDLTRCIETTNILFPGKSYHEMTGLREIDFGAWEGKTFEELRDREDYQAWLVEPFLLGPNQGENFEIFRTRILGAMDGIRQHLAVTKTTHIAIVTHGGVIRAMLGELANHDRSFFDWKIPYAGGYQLKWDHIADFKEGKKCTSLQEVPLTARRNG